ncbi:thiol-disulfide isomerase-like thioredoxin [Belliella baltica DSM 15883]|uniref:Thiol-disulfide isomerase-like thioredoxin n=1 Tax=Belliella baltica (strain DSM 15883 / CIP 108006 / LMG 21964 / BA134) TaxID=866536 RepID=I3Z859_BELBD|nr:redoxin family protein [Belliella baltica]AFL85427.1 thiol-disulfide isomerase-like thioredoxin [Belliella baltica DSM 15883]
MKNSSILWSFLAFFILSCGKQETFDPKIIIAGKLDNTDAKEINIYLEQEIAVASVEEDGSFRVDFESESTENYYVRAGREGFNLFLSPGDSVYIEANTNDFNESLKFHGDHLAENTFLFERDKLFRESGMGDMMTLMGMEKNAYFDKKDEFFATLKSRLEELELQEEIDKNFVKLEEAYINYQPLLLDSQYPMYNAYLNKIPQDSVDFPKEEVKEKLASLDLTKDDLLKSGSYKALIDRRVGEEVSEIMKQDTTLRGSEDGYEKARFLAMDKLLKNQTVKDQFLFDYIKSNLEYRGPIHVKSSYEKFIAENQSPELQAKLEKIKAKWDPIMPGQQVPDFSFVNINGEEVNLSDLRGNLVYIDIWATWCGPCIAEHPHWDKMKEEYKDKDVSFLTVSIDDSKEPWEKMVKDKNMDGLQWFSANAWKSDLAQHFMVNAIPRFLLLDKEGKIIDPSADRPSGDIRKTVDKYL